MGGGGWTRVERGRRASACRRVAKTHEETVPISAPKCCSLRRCPLDSPSPSASAPHLLTDFSIHTEIQIALLPSPCPHTADDLQAAFPARHGRSRLRCRRTPPSRAPRNAPPAPSPATAPRIAAAPRTLTLAPVASAPRTTAPPRPRARATEPNCSFPDSATLATTMASVAAASAPSFGGGRCRRARQGAGRVARRSHDSRRLGCGWGWGDGGSRGVGRGGGGTNAGVGGRTVWIHGSERTVQIHRRQNTKRQATIAYLISSRDCVVLLSWSSTKNDAY
jgi:hypothetical protein